MKDGAATEMAKSSTKYGRVTTENKEFPPEEPIFILRAQDIFAADTLGFYAEQLRRTGKEKQGREVLAIAKKFRAWPRKKMPD